MVGRMASRAARRSSWTQTLRRADQLHLGGIPTRPPRALVHRVPEEAHERLGHASLHDRAVGHAAGHPAPRRPLGGDVDGHVRPHGREVEPAVREAQGAPFRVTVLPASNARISSIRLTDGHSRAGRVDPELTEAAHAGADAEERPPPRDLVESGDSHGGQGRVARIRIGHARPESDARACAPHTGRGTRRPRGRIARRPARNRRSRRPPRERPSSTRRAGSRAGSSRSPVRKSGSSLQLTGYPEIAELHAGDDGPADQGESVPASRNPSAIFSAVIGRVVTRTPVAPPPHWRPPLAARCSAARPHPWPRRAHRGSDAGRGSSRRAACRAPSASCSR